MANVATRLITLILSLQNRPNQKASELAGSLGVSVRTLHRYFEMLEEMGIPIYSERGPYGGFSLVRGYKLPPLVFSLEEAIAIYLGTSLIKEAWGDLYRHAAQGVLAKIENILPAEQRDEIHWAQRSLVATGLTRADVASLSPVMKEVRAAIHDRRGLSMVYHGPSNKNAERRRIDPYALIFRSGWWYLVGYCHLRKGQRTFRVDRIQKLKITEKNFEIPQDFDVHEYLKKEFKDQPIIRGRLRFIPEAAHSVKANPSMWETVHENPDGSIDVTLMASDLTFLASMTVSFGPWATVMEPPELKEKVREWAESTASLYKKGKMK